MTALLRTERVFLAVVFLGIFAMAARNVLDPDIWWHLKTGQYIAEMKGVPRTDPFSYTRAGQPWVAHEWLTDLFLYEAKVCMGWGGLILIFAGILSATFFFLYLRCGPAPYIAGAATLAAAWSTMPVWGVRPQVLSLLLTSLWLLILDCAEKNPKLLWWTLPLTLLWVNLHAGFALGLVLSGLFIVGELTEAALNFSKRQNPRLRTAAFVLLLDLLVVPLNPNGWHMFWYPVETLRSRAMQSYITEWASPNFHRMEYLPFLLLLLATLAMLGWSRQKVRPRDLLLLLVSLYAGLESIRMIPLFVLVAVPLISNRIGDWPRRNSALQPQTTSRTLTNCAIITMLAVFTVIHSMEVIRDQPQAEMQHFPLRASIFLESHRPSGRIFNFYDWGGYLIWKLYPGTQVFIDGRADVYGEEVLHEFADTIQFKDGWQRTLGAWNISTVLVPVSSALATGLRGAPQWKVEYEDSQAIIMTRHDSTERTGQ